MPTIITNPFELENITQIPAHNYSKTTRMGIYRSENLISLKGIPAHIIDLTLNHVNPAILKEIPTFLPNLKRLEIVHSNLKELPIELKNCQQLEAICIDCTYLQWKQAFPILGQINSLKSLDIEALRNPKIPTEILALQQIEELHFNNKFTKRFSWKEYFDIIQQLPQLKEFTAFNSVSEIPDSIKNLKQLKKLALYHHSSKIPIEIVELSSIDIDLHNKYVNFLNTLLNDDNLSLEQKRQLFAFYIEPTYLREVFPNLIEQKPTNESWNVYVPFKIEGFSIKNLNEIFKAKNISFSTKQDEKTTHIVLSNRLKKEDLQKFITSKLHFLLEEDIKNVHWEEETPYLMVENEEENVFTEQILSLLQNSDEDNCLLALSIMENGGVNAYFIQHVLGLKLFHPVVKVRKAADKIFEKYASTGLKNLIDKKTFLTRSVKLKNIEFILDFEEIDKTEFIAIFYNIIGNNPIHSCKKGFFSFEKQNIEKIPLCLHYWTNQIIYLNLSNNKKLNFEELIDFLIEKHPSIFRLQLNNNQFKIDSKITKLTQLNYLELKNNQVNDASIFKNLTELCDLNLSKCKIKKIDIELSDKIENLDLSHNELSNIPIFSKNSKLRNLDLSHNVLEKFPQELENCSKLWEVNLSYNSISVIDEIPNSLSRLYLKKNLLKTFCLKNNLRFLDLTDNQLDEFQVEVPVDNFLYDIHLSKNKFTEFPYQLKKCKNLYQIDVSENQIQNLNAEIFSIGRRIIFNDNFISKIPEGFAEKMKQKGQYFIMKNNPLKIDKSKYFNFIQL